MQEERTAKAMIYGAGGNASKAATHCRVTIPAAWAKALQITKDAPELLLSFDGKKITIKKA